MSTNHHFRKQVRPVISEIAYLFLLTSAITFDEAVLSFGVHVCVVVCTF